MAIKRIKASEAKVGDIVSHTNKHYDYRIEKISNDNLGRVVFSFNNDTATDFYSSNEYIFIIRKA